MSHSAPNPTAPMSAPIALALQGGGAHGAFAWGALERLLEEEALTFSAVTATSAGAMNAAVLVTGWSRGGREGARAALAAFWRRVAETGPGPNPALLEALQGWPQPSLEQIRAAWELSPFYLATGLFGRFVSPYQANPFKFDPLRALLAEFVDEAALRSCESLRLFINATDVETGKAEIFYGPRLSLDAILASACLPGLFQAVHIDGRAYWDGGYTGNPALWPIIYHTRCSDALLIRLTPLLRAGAPRSVQEIDNRLNEISFNAPLSAELRAIDFVGRLVDEGLIPPEERRWRKIRLHEIHDPEAMRPLGLVTKMIPDWRVMLALREAGRAAADRWIKTSAHAVGHETTMVLKGRIL